MMRASGAAASEEVAACVAVIIVTLGDDPELPAALASLPAGVRVVVVQNGVDAEPRPLPGAGGEARIERLWRPENPGFAAAFEEGFAKTQAPFLLSLNADARLAAGSLQAACEALVADADLGAIAFRLLRPGGARLDAAGMRLGLVRRARERGAGEPAAGRFLEPARVDGACMGCALFRRAALLSARDGAGEVLDRRFFAYREDVDLGWRLRRAGWAIRYEPRALAEHVRGWREGAQARGAIPEAIRVMSLRNRWWLIAKNESFWSFAWRLPLLLAYEGLVASWLALREPRVLARYYASACGGLRESLRRRPLAKRAVDRASR